MEAEAEAEAEGVGGVSELERLRNPSTWTEAGGFQNVHWGRYGPMKLDGLSSFELVSS